LERALRFEGDGADIIDVGAESTRPGHKPISADEELRRLLPSLELLSSRVRLPISVDTYKTEVARKALEAGASMINDIWGLKEGPGLAALAAEHDVPIVIMHNQHGTEYHDLLPDIIESLRASTEKALSTGVPERNIILDPGIGFGKDPAQNIVVLRRLNELGEMGFPVLVGTSRKSLIGRVLGLPVGERFEGTAATVALSIAGGADIVRVHDVKAMVRVTRMADAIVRGWTESA
jgi:dihydropteroate synthase